MDFNNSAPADGIQLLSGKEKYIRVEYYHFYGGTRPTPVTGSSRWTPSIDLYETPEYVILEVDVAGVDPDRVEVRFSGRWLILSGHRHEFREVGLSCFHVMEIARGEFSRSIELPGPIIAQTAQASYKDGLLRLRIQKRAGGWSSSCRVSDSTEGLE